jgi:hypothetical protein
LGNTEAGNMVISRLLTEIDNARAKKLWSKENKDLEITIEHTQDQYHEFDTFPNFLPSHPCDIADEYNFWL